MGDILETFEGLAQYALDNLLLHAARPTILHHIGSTALIHQPQGNEEFMTLDPGTSNTKHVWVFR